MWQQNLAVVRAAIEALNTGDAERQEALVRNHLHPEFELHPLYFDRVYRGAPGIQEFLSDLRDTWEEYVLDLQDLIDVGERVVAVMHVGARTGQPGAGGPRPRHRLHVRGAEGDPSKSLSSGAEALEAVGLGG
jgi:SnoaL-like domain